MASFQDLKSQAGYIYGLDTDSAILKTSEVLKETLGLLTELAKRVAVLEGKSGRAV